MKRVKLLMLLAVFSVLFAGCAKKETARPEKQAGEKLKIAVIGKSVHPFWKEVEIGALAAGKELGIGVDFFVPPKEDAMEQSSRIRAFASSGVKGIAFAPSDPTTVTPAVKKAIEQGVVCICLDTDAPSSGRLAYVGTENYAAGKIAAEELAKAIKGKGKVLIATGSLTATNSLDRIKAFKDVIKEKYPQINIVDTVCDNEDSALAVSQAKQAIVAHPDINAIYGVYAINGPAAASAVKAANKVGKIHIVCFDTTPEHMKYVKEGVIDAAIGQRTYTMGFESVRLLKDIIELGKEKAFEKNKLVDGKLDTGVDVVTKASLEEYRAKLKELGIPVQGW